MLTTFYIWPKNLHTKKERERDGEKERKRERDDSQRHPTLKWPQAGREEEEVMDASNFGRKSVRCTLLQ